MKRMFDKEEIVEIAKESGGGSKKYLHSIRVQNFGYSYVITDSDTPINTVAKFALFLYENGFTESSKILQANLASYLECQTNTFTLNRIYGFYSENGTSLYRVTNTNKITATTDGSSVSFSIQNNNINVSVSSTFQVADFVQEL